MTDTEDEAKRKFGSYKLIMVEALNSDASLNWSALKTGLAILKYMNQESVDTYVSQDTLAAQASISRQSVITSIKKLSDSGWITVKQISGGRNNRRYLYRFNQERTLHFIDAANERVAIAQEQLHDRTEQDKRRRFQKRLQASHGKDSLTMKTPNHGKDSTYPWSKTCENHGKDSFTGTPIGNYLTGTPIRLAGNEEVVIEGEDGSDKREAS